MTERITGFFKSFPLHLLLLPLFFIASAYTQYAGLFFLNESLEVTLLIYAILGLTFGVLLLIYQNKLKAAVATTILGILYLFFGNIKVTLQNIEPLEFISHYKTLVPLLFISLIFFLYRLYNARTPHNVNLFLNILLIIYIGMEGWKLIRLSSTEKKITIPGNKLQLPTAGQVQKPNIYYLLLDCYPGSGYQREVLDVGYNEFDSLLSNRGFYVVDESRSNYNITSFSIASLFNMEYLEWLKEVERLRPYHYNQTIQLMKKAVVFDWLQQLGYDLNNLSIFDLPGHASPDREHFLSTTGKEIILYNTFFKCFYRDVMPQLFPSIKEKMIRDARSTRKERLQKFREYNGQVIDSLQRLSFKAKQKPFLVYAHLEMPHFPYFYDSSGKAYPEELVFGKDIITNKERFKNYIAYTNDKVAQLLDTIFAAGQGRDIIIIQSDHGLNDLDVTRKNDAFRNYSAFYFPDRDYSKLYPGMSNINSFRIIFNKYFGQQLPLLKDSTSYIK